MMKQFVVRYIPGGMSFCHSAWWICENVYQKGGGYIEHKVKYLRKSDYK